MMGAMNRSGRGWWSWSGPVVFVLAVCGSMAAVLGPARVGSLTQFGAETALLLPAVVTGCLIAVRVPTSPVGGALSWMAAAPAGVLALERWGVAIASSHPWLGFVFTTAIWPCLFLGFLALVLVFPDGLLPGRRWRLVALLAPTAALLLSAALALDATSFAAGGGPVPGRSPISLPHPVRVAWLVATFGLFVGVLAAAAASLAVRFRRGDEVTRLRVRWLMIAAGAVPVLLAGGWVAVAFGAPGDVAYEAFLGVMLLLVPAAVTVAVLRHDLFDVDRLLGEGLAWAITTLCSAGIFAVVVTALAEVFGRDSVVGVTGAAFVTALCLLPIHRALVGVVGRLVDRERHVLLARVRQFVQEVRDGTTEPEAVEELLRAVLGDSSLRLLVRRPGEGEAGALVDLKGARARWPRPRRRLSSALATPQSGCWRSATDQPDGCGGPSNLRSRRGYPSRSAASGWNCAARWTMRAPVGPVWRPLANRRDSDWNGTCTMVHNSDWSPSECSSGRSSGDWTGRPTLNSTGRLRCSRTR